MLKIIKKHKKHFSNSASFLLMRVFIYAASLVVIPYFINQRGQDLYALIAFFSVMISYSVLLENALSYSVSLRYTTSLVKNPEESLLIIQSAIPIYFLFGFLTLLGLNFSANILSILIWGTAQYSKFISFLGLILCLQVFDALFSSIIQSHNNLLKLNINRLLSDLIRLAGFILAVFFEPALQICLTFFLLGSIVKLYLDVKYCNKVIGSSNWFRPSFSMSEFKENARLAPFMFVNSALWLVISCFDKIYVAKQVSVHDYAFYAFAIDVCTKAYVLFYAITGTLYNSLIRRHANVESVSHIIKVWLILFAVIACFYYLPLYVWGDILIEHFINHDFAVHTMPIVKILIFASLCYLALAILENNLNAMGKARSMTYVYLFGLVSLYFSFNYLVDKTSMAGVAISIAAMYFLMLIATVTISIRAWVKVSRMSLKWVI